MTVDKNKLRARLSWLSMVALFVLCGVLGYLQYRWIDEVSIAARERAQVGLQAGLNRLRTDFNSEILAACRAMAPATAQPSERAAEADVAARYQQWRKTATARDTRIFERVAIVSWRDEKFLLRTFDLQKASFATTEWPASWKSIKDRLEARLTRQPRENRDAPAPPENRNAPLLGPESPQIVFDLPVFSMGPPGPPPGSLGGRSEARVARNQAAGFGLVSNERVPAPEAAWLILELNLDHVRAEILPELVRRHLGSDYQVEVETRTNPPSRIFASDTEQTERISATADASVTLFAVPYEGALRRMGPPNGPGGGPRAPGMGMRGGLGPGMRGRGPGQGPGPRGGWQMPGMRDRGFGEGRGPGRGPWRGPEMRDQQPPEAREPARGTGGMRDSTTDAAGPPGAGRRAATPAGNRAAGAAAEGVQSSPTASGAALAGGDAGPGGLGLGLGPPPTFDRWQMFVRNRAGSLEAVVSRARWRNMAVTGAVLLLLLASVAALVRFTRRAQRLAALQMDFVAGVSHELRTPLTVIHTAAYNLRGRLAENPAQVERYGSLIQQESGRLKTLVEQVLQFSSAKAGRLVQDPQPLSVEAVINEALESSKAVTLACVVETHIEPGLPAVLGDAAALRHAVQNLVSNAAKYGTQGSNWIGVFAAKADGAGQPGIEIRVADRGPGIPGDEQDHVFDPFFRGRRALQDQVHGTGLGLSLTKNIVEAHGGSIRVKSHPEKGTEFIVRLPAAPDGAS